MEMANKMNISAVRPLCLAKGAAKSYLFATASAA